MRAFVAASAERAAAPAAAAPRPSSRDGEPRRRSAERRREAEAQAAFDPFAPSAPPVSKPKPKTLKPGEWGGLEAFLEDIGLGKCGYGDLFVEHGLDTPEALTALDPPRLRKLGVSARHAQKLRMGISELRAYAPQGGGGAPAALVSAPGRGRPPAAPTTARSGGEAASSAARGPSSRGRLSSPASSRGRLSSPVSGLAADPRRERSASAAGSSAAAGACSPAITPTAREQAREQPAPRRGGAQVRGGRSSLSLGPRGTALPTAPRAVVW